METVGHSCEVHLLLRGLVDVEKEVAKIEEKISKLNNQLEKLMKGMSIENYEEKVCEIFLINPLCTGNSPFSLPLYSLCVGPY